MYTIDLQVDERSPFRPRKVFVNGRKIDRSSGFLSEGLIEVSIFDKSAAQLILDHSLGDIPPNVAQFTVTREPLWDELQTSAVIKVAPRTIEVRFTVNLETWSGPWSIRKYVDAVSHSLAMSDLSSEIQFREHDLLSLNGFSFECPIRSSTSRLEGEIEYWTEAVKPIIRSARVSLSAEAEKNTLVTLFDFPPSISTACEQYLLYFVQFLRDLGIEAGASIKHEARQVLFSVTPSDGAEALDRIREALNDYLSLPDSPEFAAQAPGYGDIAVQQLQANIFHLKGQLAISGAVLQAKNAQIKALQLSNFTYQQLLANQQQVATIPLLPAGTSDADAEPLVPGVIHVTKYEGKGFTVNLPELLRRLKRRFDYE